MLIFFRLPKVKKRSHVSKANSVISNTTAEDYLSAVGSVSSYDSSDLEYYDISEDETEALVHNSTSSNLEGVCIINNFKRFSQLFLFCKN